MKSPSSRAKTEKRKQLRVPRRTVSKNELRDIQVNSKAMINMGDLAEASHAFTTNDGKGRLLLRDIEFHEADQYISIRQDKANNKFAPYKPIADPEAKLKDLAMPVLTKHRAASKMFRLAVISKAEIQFKHKKLMVNGGTLVGVVDFALNSWDQSAHIGILIHHLFTPQHYAKEALFAVLDYAFLGDPKPAWNGVLGRLGLEKVVLEGEKADLGFKNLLQSLHIEHCGKPTNYSNMIHTITKRDWEFARSQVTFNWMSPNLGQSQKLGSTSLGLIGLELRNQPKQLHENHDQHHSHLKSRV